MHACLKLVKVCLLNLPSFKGCDSQVSSQLTILVKKIKRSSLTVKGRHEESFKRIFLYGIFTLNMFHNESRILTKLEVFVFNALQR